MMLHRSIVVGSLLVFSIPAVAQTVTVETPTLSQIVPMPREEAGVSGYRILAIATGAVVGVIVANALTGGMITPILMAGTGGAAVPMMVAAEPVVAAAAVEAVAAPAVVAAAPAVVEVAPAAPAAVVAAPAMAATVATPVVAGVSYAYMAAQTGIIIVGGVVGGYIGNWIYGAE